MAVEMTKDFMEGYIDGFDLAANIALELIRTKPYEQVVAALEEAVKIKKAAKPNS